MILGSLGLKVGLHCKPLALNFKLPESSILYAKPSLYGRLDAFEV